MTEAHFGEYRDISSPGADARRWRYPLRLRLIGSGMDRDEERLINVDVVVTDDLAAMLNLDDTVLEKVVFALVSRHVKEHFVAGDPGEKIDITLGSHDAPKARKIDPEKVPPPGRRVLEVGDSATRHVETTTTEAKRSAPTAFISYARGSAAHMLAVKNLATGLRQDGIDVKLDQWEAVPGDQLPHFMERAVAENDFVLIVCTPHYKKRSDARIGGVGYEGDIMTAEVLTQGNNRKFIPVLWEGDWPTALPRWLAGKYGIDLRGDPYSEDQYRDLVNTLLGTREQAPPIGNRGGGSDSSPEPGAAENDDESFEPVRILGVVVDEVGAPRNDGTRGCALYEVPFRLPTIPPAEWAEYFVAAWDHPPRFTSMHRPGIARVVSNRVILNGTTMEEVEEVHRNTMRLALDTANRQYQELLEERGRVVQEEADRREDHLRRVREIADRIKFE